jgi:hypothetical protein
MKSKVRIEAGICGFQTDAAIQSDDDQMVAFDVQSGCEKIRSLGELLRGNGPIDAYQEIGPKGESVILGAARSVLKGCCAGCVVPVGLFKGMQVAAGLALPKDIRVDLSKE